MRMHYTSKQRAELVDLVTAGGATVSEAAERLGVTRSTAYYWMKGRGALRGRQVRRSHVSTALRLAEPTFIRVVPSSEVPAVITVRMGGAEIQVGRDFDANLLRAVVDALRGGGA